MAICQVIQRLKCVHRTALMGGRSSTKTPKGVTSTINPGYGWQPHLQQLSFSTITVGKSSNISNKYKSCMPTVLDDLICQRGEEDPSIETSAKKTLQVHNKFLQIKNFHHVHGQMQGYNLGNISQRENLQFPTTNSAILNLRRDIQLLSRRSMSSSVFTDLIPEFAKQYSIWGGSAIILKTFHGQNIPYWACMSLTNILVRTSLLPLVIKGAKTSVQFANVAPEVQFLVSCYTRDAKTLKDANAPPSQRMELLVATWQSLRGIYRLHKVNPFDVLKSPLMQIPVFWYFSVDIRKLINGGNPELAQELTESGFLWVMDLTEPDPWYGLPILSGLLLYLNVEVAVGKQSLSGETASKSNIARYLKDGFQSLAVLMPCLMAQSPAGVQIYLLTSFTYTLFQGAALRNDAFRKMVNLPPRGAPPPEGKLVKEFILYNKLERDTYGVLSPKFHSSFRPYAHLMSPDEMKRMEQKAKQSKKKSSTFDGVGVWAADYQPSFQPSPIFVIAQGIKRGVERDNAKKGQNNRITSDRVIEIAPSPDEVMEAANKGERPAAPIKIASEIKTDPASLNLNKRKIVGKQSKKRNIPKKR